MAVDSKLLLQDLRRQVKRLEEDLRQRAEMVPEMERELTAEYERGRAAGRIGEAFEPWRDDILTQAAVHWVLGCVFVRFLEDNGLLDEVYLAGPDGRTRLAAERQTLYFREHPTDSDREYLYHVFRTVGQLPAAERLFDRAHNPVWTYGISADAARDLVGFWRQVMPESGELVHNFKDDDWNTRFLGDLYQDLSDEAKSRYALLQTPEFVEEFILDRTLEPAIREFGLAEVRLIDPTCGSGHFLLGAFHRLLRRWQEREPATMERELVRRALNGVYGVDLNPFAVAIAQFRLLIAALKASGLQRLREAPAYTIHVAAGDSLLHGRRFGELELSHLEDLRRMGHAFHTEDLEDVDRILGQQYHAVVGNPPYIMVKDRSLNQLYRERYATCHMRYAVSVPFTERFFELAIEGTERQPAGFIGMITANSFMKREFGKKLVEEFISKVDLTHVIDTAGAYIPGHGTPTVTLFGRHRAPVSDTIRTAMGIQGEPSTPANPARGQVWSALLEQIDLPGSESAFLSVADSPRANFVKHPWSIGGGGASDLKDALDEAGSDLVRDLADEIGITAVTGEDSAYVLDSMATARRLRVDLVHPLITGESVRDWVAGDVPAVWLYDSRYQLVPLDAVQCTARHLWPYRTGLSQRKRFGTPMLERGLEWYEYQELYETKLRSPLLIVFSEVATHNQFALCSNGRVIKNSALVIKLKEGTSVDEHLGVLGILNSALSGFWLKQVAHNKGSTVDQHGARQRTTPFEDFYSFNSTKIAAFPVAEERPTDLAKHVHLLAGEREIHLPDRVAARLPISRAEWERHHFKADRLLRHMIALQEELDWRCYRLYGITPDELTYRDGAGEPLTPPEIRLGERAFEIVLARRLAEGEEETTWFQRHGSTPTTEVPAHWPEDYRRLVERRIERIERDRYVGLVERPEYKRRWNQEPWDAQAKRALEGWLLDRLETPRYWPEPRLQTVRELAARAETDADFMSVAELYTGHPGFDVYALVRGLVEGEAVSFLPVLRYKPSGLRKREVWERTWDLQRLEDGIDAQAAAELTPRAGESEERFRERLKAEQDRRKQEQVGDIPRPPKYTSADFLNSAFWRLRGPLDVPKERFVSYPFCSRESDPSLLLGWAGWDHLQQMQALAGWYHEGVEREGWTAERARPLLAGLDQLLPWVKQWHNEPDPEFGPMGDFYEVYLDGQLHHHGLTLEAVRSWEPPAAPRRRRAAART